MKPALLVHPAMGGFEARLGEICRVVHWPQAGAEADATAALVIGASGLTNEQIAALPNLRLIACMGVGYDGIDTAFTRERGIIVTNTPHVNHEDVADVALGLMLSVARNIAAGDRALRAGAWRDTLPQMRRFSGRKLGVVGLGAIGRAVAERGQGFRLETAWTGPHPKPDAPWRYEPDLHALARWADILVIACPATPETFHLIDASVLDALGPQGMLINIARGALVDEDALLDALKSGRLGGAGLDVMRDEPTDPARWADVPNVSLTPHLAGATREAMAAGGALAVENVRRFFAGEAPLTPVY